MRLIPAHAGSTTWSHLYAGDSTAHPRSRGEHVSSLRNMARASGSSPLTRGALSWVCRRGDPPRLIPAHAGSTTSPPPPKRSPPAHPRSRGEHTSPTCRQVRFGGSSPLTRGAHLMICHFRAFVDPFLGILAAPVVVSRSCSYRDVGVPHPDLTVVPARSHRHIHPDEP